MCPKTLRNWRASGKGPVGIRQGRGLVFHLEAVLEWEAQQDRNAATELESKLLSDDYTITVRQHPKYPNRQQADLLLPTPYKRARIAVPQGMTSEKDIERWARREGRRIMRDQKIVLDEKKEDTPKTITSTSTKPGGSMSLQEFWTTRFTPEVIQGQKPGTRSDTDTAWRLHISLELGDVPLAEIDAMRIYQFQALLKAKPELKRPTTRNKIIQKLKACLRYAIKRKVLPFDHDLDTDDEKVAKIPKQVFSPEEVEKMVAAGRGFDLEHEVFILLLAHGCLRIGELNGLHWTDLNLDARTMRVQRTEWMRTLQDSPKGQIGTVPMTEALHGALVRWKEVGGDRGPLVLPMFDGKGWRCRHGPALLIAILKRAKLRAEGPHMIRHSVLTHLAEAGVSPYALQALARHSHLSTTMRYYIHLEQAKLAGQAVSIIDKMGGCPAGPDTPMPPAVTHGRKLRLAGV